MRSILRTALRRAQPQLSESAGKNVQRRFAAATENQNLLAHKIIKAKPTTPGQRGLVRIDRSELWDGRPVRDLTEAKPKKGGRGHRGRVSNPNIGGGHKRRYRLIDFKRAVHNVWATVQRLEYDPNRSAYIALIKYEHDESISYIIAPQGIEPGMRIISTRTEDVPIKLGNSMPLALIPLGTQIHNIEIYPGKGGQMCRSAGSGAELLDKDSKLGFGLVRLASKEEKYVRLQCMATIGTVSNPLHNRQRLGKAGRRRWLGRRPRSRGVAMNPIDHPMGGGEGKSKGGRPSCGPTGILAHGFKTRRKPPSKLVVIPRGGLRKLSEENA